jgi:uncharacterized repeat protein (TIGR03803 family)
LARGVSRQAWVIEMARATKNHKKQRMKTCIKNPFPLPTLIAGLGLILTSRAASQTFTTLHSFDNSDGAGPQAGLVVSGNTLYGAADSGGDSYIGTVFALSTDGADFATLYSLYVGSNFSSPGSTNSDGAYSDGTLVFSGDTLYGTAYWGGTNGNGTVFKVNTNGTFTTLHSFAAGSGFFPRNYTNSDGACPEVGLVLSGNTLYGTTEKGGSSGFGTVFKVNTDGTGFMNLHNFTNGSDGAIPHGLVISGNTLYGTALGLTAVGLSGNGTVFALNTDGTDFRTLHSFTEVSLGLTISGNTLYGTALGSSANGTVFAINTDGTGFTNLYTFTATSGPLSTNSDGAEPIENGGLVLSGNTLYGTANSGGSAGNGTVFALNTNGTGFTTLYSFTATDANGNNSDGAHPYAGLSFSGSTLYGTTKAGGTNGDGTVFSISLALTVTTTSLPNGTDGSLYSQQLSAVNGQPPYSWSLISGSLPSGLTLATNGVISGTPTSNGTNNLTVQVTDILSATATQPLTLTVLVPNPNLVLNGGFETSDFTGWTVSGSDTNDVFVDDGSNSGLLPHSGSYCAALGPTNALGYLFQPLATIAGARYTLSLWLDSPDGQTPNEFLVSWNGITLFDETNLPVIGWTNMQFVVTASGTSTVLQFGFRDDPSYLGLDDISVMPYSTTRPPAILSAPQIAAGKTNFTFLLSGPCGSNYVLEVSTNLLNWDSYSTSTIPVSGSITVTNAISAYNRRFYRVYLE